MTDFVRFDRSHYETLTPCRGYAAWAPTYDDTVGRAQRRRVSPDLCERRRVACMARERRRSTKGAASGRSSFRTTMTVKGMNSAFC